LGLFAVTVYTAVQIAVNTAPVTVPYRRFQQQLTVRQVPGRHTVQTRTVRAVYGRIRPYLHRQSLLSFRCQWRRLAYLCLSFCSSPCPTRLNHRVSWTSSLVCPLCVQLEFYLGPFYLCAAHSTLPLR
ncbi:hypothetical protein B0H14DRAFT_2960072, partial [Mycena olivaceomarginata]